ncbi:MAG: 4Fe-4S dicluster domain-containing protein [Dethiobacter sp.]|jgi:Pyruvate/2-oxoacid:ferredoxin oxidoreductase delta subunit|nr:4Fe-4S dicluster domain-containing protein [Dethiobacter sp.]MBS3899207.1 4Fe-4S dicluster domain-containing protein [Dethiobacter sp.]MCL4462573.1 4Fe-4S dicluster domain-containing protein [Bacillota bacterium]
MKLNKDKLADFLAAIPGKTIFGPQLCGETLKFTAITKAGDLCLTANNTNVPPKSVVFPQTETMLRFEQWATDIKTAEPAGEIVLFGIKPCDARAMLIVDNVFSWGVEDPYYLTRRTNSTLVGLACLDPCVNCFCTSMGGGPTSTDGLDLLLTDLGNSYLLEVLTGKGEVLCQAAGKLLCEASGADKDAAKLLQEKAAVQIRRQIDPSGVQARLPALWESPVWEKISASCLGCGICTYLCPTCHCFDMQDETEGVESRRCRTWDSCMFSEYTLHASGHNPRPTRRERTRNRINHKFSYFVDKFKVIACVGCGRCINHCPVNIDILDILSKVGEDVL